jgi:hypothetical protein
MNPTDPDFERARKRRSIAIAMGLVAFAILIFVVTYVRLQGNVPTERF